MSRIFELQPRISFVSAWTQLEFEHKAETKQIRLLIDLIFISSSGLFVISDLLFEMDISNVDFCNGDSEILWRVLSTLFV
jgi:hypothetical protein